MALLVVSRFTWAVLTIRGSWFAKKGLARCSATSLAPEDDIQTRFAGPLPFLEIVSTHDQSLCRTGSLTHGPLHLKTVAQVALRLGNNRALSATVRGEVE
jgi:hypothetical protein